MTGQARTRLRLPLLVGCLLFLSSSQVWSDATDAATRDWVDRDSLMREQRREVPGYCAGTYIEPEIRQPAKKGWLDGVADLAGKGLDGSYLKGNASLSDGKRQISADNIHLNQTRSRVSLNGEVSIRQPGLLLSGSEGQVDLDGDAAEVTDASFLIHEARLRGSADRIVRTREGVLLIHNGWFTRCDPNSNIWSIKGRSMKLEPDAGQGTATGLVARIMGLPLVYFPWLRFPIDDRRRSGFLNPSLSYDDEAGLDLTLPYYFNLAPQVDATYSLRPVSRRGLVQEAQLRFLAAASINEINVGYLQEDDIYSPVPGENLTQAQLAELPARDSGARWYLNLRHEAAWNRRWYSRIRYSSVSDADYLRDLGGNLDGFSNQQHYGYVDTGLGGRRSVLLDRYGQVEYRGDAWNYLLQVQSFQSLAAGETLFGYSRMPRLVINWRPRLAGWEPSLFIESVRFTSSDDQRSPDLVPGSRLSLVPAVTVSLRTEYGYLKPRLELDYRRYFLEGPEIRDDLPEFVIPAFSLDAGLYFDRFFSFQGRNYQQTLEPRLFYLLREEDSSQNDLPLFDTGELTPSYSAIFHRDRFSGRDRVGDANQLVAGLAQRLIDRDTGRERFRLSVGQIQYFRDRKVLHPFGLAGLDPLATRSPVFVEMTVSPYRYWVLLAAVETEPDKGGVNRSSLVVRYNRDDHTLFNFSYRRTDRSSLPVLQSVEESLVNFILPLGNRWSLIGHWNYGWDRKETLEAIAGIEYNDCCWRARVFFRSFQREPRLMARLVTDQMTGIQQRELIEESRQERGIFFEFQMKGVGTLGRRVDSLLGNTIAGYRRREAGYSN